MSTTGPVLRVRQSARENLKLVLMAVVMLAASVFVVLSADSLPMALAGWAGLVFFGAGSVVLGHRALALRGPVLVVDGAGIHDRRVSRDVLPWHEVRSAGVWGFSGQRMLVLTVDDAAWERIGVLALPRATRTANRSLGVDGLTFTTEGLPVGFDELTGAVEAHLTDRG